MTKFQIQSVVTGYHAYRKKPDVGTTCRVTHEMDNKFDSMSLAVVDKSLGVIGHVPANPVPLRTAFYNIMDLSKSIEIKW